MAEKQAVNGSSTGMLAAVERIGNKLPDPAVLLMALLFIVALPFAASAGMAYRGTEQTPEPEGPSASA